jgi:hypothetical protein
MAMDHYLVDYRLAWIPPTIPVRRAYLQAGAAERLMPAGTQGSGIFRLSEFPAREWVVMRRRSNGVYLPPERAAKNERTTPLVPAVALVSSEEIGQLLERGERIDVLDGPFDSRLEALESLTQVSEALDGKAAGNGGSAAPVNAPPADAAEPTYYYDVDGAPAVIKGIVALKWMGSEFQWVTPSHVRAEGAMITRAEFDRMVRQLQGRG